MNEKVPEPIAPFIDLISGPAFKSAHFSENPSDIALIKGENIGQGVIEWEKSKYWPASEFDAYEKFELFPGDIVLAMDRPWVTAGLKFAVLREGDPRCLLVQRVARLRGINGLDTRYLRYLVASRHFSDYIKNLQGGTNVPHISGNQIRQFKTVIPPKDTQQRICEILENYDDLIENNRRRIKLLEEAARLIYREWFVHLRFPGHEHTKSVDGLPEGWHRMPVAQAIDFNSKETLPKGGIRFIPMGALSESGMTVDANLTEIRESGTTVKFRNGDTLLARITPCLENGKTAFVGFLNEGEVASGSTEFIVMRGAKVGPCFTYCLARSEEFRGIAVASMVGSSGRQRAQVSVIGEFSIILPISPLLEAFEFKVQQMFDQIWILVRANERLTTARDLLLPRLMSGEIEV